MNRQEQRPVQFSFGLFLLSYGAVVGIAMAILTIAAGFISFLL